MVVCAKFYSLITILPQASGKARLCMVSEFFEKPHDAASEEILKNCAGLAYAGTYQVLPLCYNTQLFCIAGSDTVRSKPLNQSDVN